MDLAPRPTSLDTSVDPYRTYLDSLTSTESRRTMRGCLDRIAAMLAGDDTATGQHQPWHLLRYHQTAGLKKQMRQRGWSAAYINKHLVALRRVLKEAWRLGLMSSDEFQQATDVASDNGQRLPTGRHIPSEVIGAVLAACDGDGSPAGRRDAAIIAVLCSTGCRRGEIAALTITGYDPRERSLTVIGKGDKQRIVHLHSQAVVRVERWLNVRGRGDGALFCPVNRFGRLRLRENAPVAMSGQGIADVLARRLAACGGEGISAHDFRRTFIGELLDTGTDLATVQEIAGHASPVTTAGYDRRPQRRRRAAVDRLHLPGM